MAIVLFFLLLEGKSMYEMGTPDMVAFFSFVVVQIQLEKYSISAEIRKLNEKLIKKEKE